MSKTLGIFLGKKATYNQQILKALATGPKITWQLAEYIYLNRGTLPTNKLNKNKIRSINKTLCFKEGRLNELKKKEYIIKKEGIYDLTNKGRAVSLTLFDDLSQIMPLIKDYNPSEVIEKIEEAFTGLFGEFVTRQKGFQNLLSVFNKPFFSQLLIQTMRDFTNKMIKDGVNLDNMSDKEFEMLEANRISHFFMEMSTQKSSS